MWFDIIVYSILKIRASCYLKALHFTVTTVTIELIHLMTPYLFYDFR